MTLPVSVIVPLSAHRMPLFESAVLPSIRQNDPAEIHLIPGDANANVKRNLGAAKAGGQYLFFCDDDVILADDCIPRLCAAMDSAPRDVAYTYGDFLYVSHPRRKTGTHKADKWNAAALRRANYISTMSLIRRDVFPGFDESIERLQDYDLWLTLLGKGYVGRHIGGHPLFCALHLGDNITKRSGFDEAMKIVHAKHGIGAAV